ncbi:hypothetical protein [Sphingomonas sp. Leaf22]|nr:hypothetical protein [Sphingomonas sp. Leaf22]
MRRLPGGARDALFDIGMTVVVILGILTTAALVWFSADCIFTALSS